MAIVTSIATKVLVTVTVYHGYDFQGDIYNGFYEQHIPFRNSFEMIDVMESLFDELSFPQASVMGRSFYKQEKKRSAQQKSGECMKNNGPPCRKTKFIVHVHYRQNATWQGTIQWVDENKTQNFRSALEMLKLMDEALSQTDDLPISFEQEA